MELRWLGGCLGRRVGECGGLVGSCVGWLLDGWSVHCDGSSVRGVCC